MHSPTTREIHPSPPLQPSPRGLHPFSRTASPIGSLARVVDRASSTTSRTLGRGRAGERAGREVVTRAVTPSPSPSSLGEPSASNAATYDGTVVFHVYDSLEAPKPIFSTFLEGALHVVEVARFHPNFVSAHFHYALKDGEQKIDAKTPNSCFNCTLLDDVAPDAAFETFGDLVDAIEMGHLNQREHALACREIAVYAPSDDAGASAFAKMRAKRRELVAEADGAADGVPVFGFDESNVVLFVGVRANASDIDSTWPHVFGVSGAEALVGSNTFQDASLFEVVTCSKRDETEHRFTHIVRVSLGPIGDDEALVRAAEDAVKRACATLDSDAFVSSYACVFNIGKSGTPPGALPAVREMAKKKKEAEALRA